MNPALVVMAILGCGDGGDQCQTVRVEPTQFVSVAACNAAAETTLQRYTGLTYPVIAVRCQKPSAPTYVAAAAQVPG